MPVPYIAADSGPTSCRWGGAALLRGQGAEVEHSPDAGLGPKRRDRHRQGEAPKAYPHS